MSDASGWRAPGRGKVPTWPIAACGLTLLLLALSVAALRALGTDASRIPPDVTIAGIAVGGLTMDEARRAILAGAEPPPGSIALRAAPVPGFALDVETAYLAPRARIRAAIVAAGAENSYPRRLFAELGIPQTHSIPLGWTIERARIASVVVRAAKAIDRPPREARVEIHDGVPRVREGRAGRRVDRAGLRDRLLDLPAHLEVPVEEVEPSVTTAEARAAADHARRLVDAPIQVVGGGRVVTVAPASLRRAARVRANGGVLVAGLDGGVLARALAPSFGELTRRPRIARFRLRGKRVEVVPSRVGRRLDGAAIAAEITRRPQARRVRARFEVVAPPLTTAEARALRVTEPVGSFTTQYPCCQPRVENIRRAAKILDGTVVGPGGRFSLNQALGERTRERGFVPAPQISAGRLEDAVGGGVSQIATTFFNAAWFAGLTLESHTPHEFYISRYPPGREATISWGGPELVVVNSWPAGLLIKAETTATSITVRLYSATLGRRVETTMGPSPGAGAFAIDYGRRVYRNGALKERDDFTWSYRTPPET